MKDLLCRMSPPCVLAMSLAGTVTAAEATQAFSSEELRRLADLSIEELMDEPITSVSKKDQKLGDAAAAVTVLTSDDLRRSGATSIADALRLVPGMNVGAYNSNQVAISARGFNNVYANKLLVMVDGRTVYTPLFSGVYWDLQQPMLEDIERIEVIRGPGATVWGANAVNGVINIITRKARDSQGGFAYAGAGDLQRAMAGARYGGKLGNHGAYRVFGSYEDVGNYRLSNGQQADDQWRNWSTGFHLDQDAGSDTHLTWQGDFTSAKTNLSDAYDVNTLGRWTRTFSTRSNLEVQAYYDRVYRDDYTTAFNATDTFDFSLQHQLPLGAANDLIWGGGYRYTTSQLDNRSVYVMVRQPHVSQRVWNGFVQDEWTLIPNRFTVTGGVKLEHNDITGTEVAPSIRTAFKPKQEQTIWAAISRAVRTPSVLEGTDTFALTAAPPFAGPGGFYLPVLTSNPQIKSEVLRAYELGYRIQPNPKFSLDLSTFYNDYSRIITNGQVPQFVPGLPLGLAQFPWTNTLNGETHGGELQAKFSPSEAWRLTAGYALLIAKLHGSTPEDDRQRSRSAPRDQANIGVSHQFTLHSSADLQIRYVGSIDEVPSYFTADLQVNYRLTDTLDLALVGRNLLDGQHLEQKPLPNLTITEVPRSVYLKLRALF